MSLQRSRPMDTLQRIISSFKHFEKKLDKLQDDVNFQGHTLTDLRVMVANLSGGILNTDEKPQDNNKKLSSANKTTAVQPEDQLNSEGLLESKRKKVIQPFISKIQPKIYQSPKHGSKLSKDVPFVNKLPISPKTELGSKRSPRQRKGESPRKATTLRGQKEMAKKRNKVPQHNVFSL